MTQSYLGSTTRFDASQSIQQSDSQDQHDRAEVNVGHGERLASMAGGG